jgi:hypothetical protein
MGTPKQSKQDPMVDTPEKKIQLPSITMDVHTGVSQIRPKIRFYISVDRLVFHPISRRIAHKKPYRKCVIALRQPTHYLLIVTILLILL